MPPDNSPEEQHSNRFVRLRLQASNLYLVGWWGGPSGQERYHYVVRNQVMPPVSGGSDLAPVASPFKEDHGSIEQEADGSSNRTGIEYDQGTFNGAMNTLLHARDTRLGTSESRNQARAFLVMTQAVSEAARFRPIAGFMATANDAHTRGHLSGYYVSMENHWSEFSRRFNQLLREQRDDTPEDALTQYVYRKSPDTGKREWDLVALITRARYAQYLLQTALGK